MALQNEFNENFEYPAGSICYAYGLMCDSATLVSGVCPHPGFDGAVVVVYGAFANRTACDAVLTNLSTAPLANSLYGVQLCATNGCNTAAFVSAARGAGARGVGAPGVVLLVPLLLAVARLVAP